MRIIKIAVIIIATVLLTWSGVELTIGWIAAKEIWSQTVSIFGIVLSFSPVWLGLLYGVMAGLVTRFITRLIPDGSGLLLVFFLAIPTTVLLYSFFLELHIETVMLASCMLISYVATATTALLSLPTGSD